MSTVPTWTLWLAPVSTLLAALLGAIVGGWVSRLQARDEARTQLAIDERRYRRSVAIQLIHHASDVSLYAGQASAGLKADLDLERLLTYSESCQVALGALSRSVDEIRAILPPLEDSSLGVFFCAVDVFQAAAQNAAQDVVESKVHELYMARTAFLVGMRENGLGALDDVTAAVTRA